MSTDHELRRLADADPAGGLDPVADEGLLARLLAQPRSAGTSSRRSRVRFFPRRPAIALAIAAVAVAVVLVANPAGPVRTTGPGSLALAAQAYAKTSAAPDAIVHTLATFESTGRTASVERGSIEEWHRGDETHRIEKHYSANGYLTAALDHVIDTDGVMRQVNAEGGYRIIRASDNEDAANVIAQQQSGFIEEFRRRYERGQLDPAGDAQFAGRPARRYVVTAQDNSVGVERDGVEIPGARLPGPDQAYYIDRETAQPLGFTSTMAMNISDGRGGTTPTTMRYTQTVKTLERLAPTTESIAALRTLSLPRRRDADGCIRGPVTRARSSDTASKTDCGGTPGAPINP